MNFSLKPYKRDSNFSYTVGVYNTLELLKYQPQRVVKVYVSEHGEKNQGLAKIRAICQARNIFVEEASGLILKHSGKENCYAIAAFQKYTCTLSTAENHIVLVNPSDMGNMGSIIRTMVGFGFNDLAIIRPAVDIFDPKVIRASQGAIFQVRFANFPSFDAYKNSFPRQYYPFMTNAGISLSEAKFAEKFSLIFGNEGAGLAPNFKNIGQSISILHSKNIDSLNLSVAVGIALFQAKKS